MNNKICLIISIFTAVIACASPMTLDEDEYIRFLTHKVHYFEFYKRMVNNPNKAIVITKDRIATGDTLVVQNILQLDIREPIAFKTDSTKGYLFGIFFEEQRVHYLGGGVADGVLQDLENKIICHQYGGLCFDSLYIIEELADYSNAQFIKDIEATEHCNSWLKQYVKKFKSQLLENNVISMRSSKSKKPEFIK